MTDDLRSAVKKGTVDLAECFDIDPSEKAEGVASSMKILQVEKKRVCLGSDKTN